ncbi:hypothetical protein [Streptomyces sp. NPDC060035]|uniref:hypothetical protein n=1 Tax=Streptomyces sp. NPDC060035 TaxID=3347044 RepID=UPI0036A01C17
MKICNHVLDIAPAAGTQRQHSGTAGRTESCQIGVLPAYASDKGRAGPALVDGDSIASLTLERRTGEDGAEPCFRLGAVGNGPCGHALAERLCVQIPAWGRRPNRGTGDQPYPAGTPDYELTDGYVVERRSARMVISY